MIEKQRKAFNTTLDPNLIKAFKYYCREQKIGMNDAIEALISMAITSEVKFKKTVKKEVETTIQK